MFRRSRVSSAVVTNSAACADVINKHFQEARSKTLANLASGEKDKSIIGGVDAGVQALVMAINSHENMYTTSSCSGRISLFHRSAESKSSKMKRGGGQGFLFVSHEPIPDAEEVSAVAASMLEKTRACRGSGGGEVAFKFEPAIIHVNALDIETAQKLMDCAFSSAFRTSGLTAPATRFSLSKAEREQLLTQQEHQQYTPSTKNSSSDGGGGKVQILSHLDARLFRVNINSSNNQLNHLLSVGGNVLEDDVAVIEKLIRHCNDSLFPRNEERKLRLLSAINKAFAFP